MADRSLFIGHIPGLLDGIWTTPLGTLPASSGALAPRDAQPSSSSLPSVLDERSGPSSAMPYTFRALDAAVSSAPHEDSSSPSDTAGLWGAAQHWDDSGSQLRRTGRPILVANPIVDMRWQPTTSSQTGIGGFVDELRGRLLANDISIGRLLPAPPPDPRIPAGAHQVTQNRGNGLAAERAIANYHRALGFEVRQNVRQAGGRRWFDIVVERPALDPAFNRRTIIESKLGETGLKGRVPGQLEFDAEYLRQNRARRMEGEVPYRSGSALRAFGRVMRPVGIVNDAMELGSAYQADGKRIGENTQRTASGIAGGALGGWGGAAGGAAIGTAILPGPGTVVGGVAGGLLGAYGGDLMGRDIFDRFRRPPSAYDTFPSLGIAAP